MWFCVLTFYGKQLSHEGPCGVRRHGSIKLCWVLWNEHHVTNPFFIAALTAFARHVPPAPVTCSFLPHIPAWTSVLLNLHPVSISGCTSLKASGNLCSDTQTSSGRVGVWVRSALSVVTLITRSDQQAVVRSLGRIQGLMTVLCEGRHKWYKWHYKWSQCTDVTQILLPSASCSLSNETQWFPGRSQSPAKKKKRQKKMLGRFSDLIIKQLDKTCVSVPPREQFQHVINSMNHK